jgi:PAS domain S-box-containing protein
MDMATPLAIEAAAARYRALFEAAADPILVVNADGRYVDANPAALALLGFTLEELLQLQVSDLSTQAQEGFRAEHERLKRDREWRGESLMRRKDGSVFPIEVRASQALLPEGTLYFANVRDITERKRVETRLQASETRLAALLEQLPVAVGLTDAEGQWVLANALMGRFVDHVIPSRDPSQISRWRSWDANGQLMPPAQWPGAAALRGERVPGMDFLFTTESGEELWTRVSAEPFHNAAGEVVGAICVIEDVDARKRAVAALQESEARYRTLVHAAANTVWRISGDGEWLLEVQGGAVEPYALEKGPTRDWPDRYIHPEDQGGALLAWRQAVQNRSVFPFRQRARSRDGSYRWIEGTTVPVLDERGEVREWIGTSVDITERLAAEATAARVVAIVASSQDAILSETLDGIILDWNPGAEALYGYSSEEAVGRDVAFLVPPDLAHELTAALARLRRGEHMPPLETVRLHKDGTRVDVEVRLSPIRNGDGQIVGISAVARDITERQRLERLRQDILAMVSHDLRNPLSVISLRAQLLQSRRVYDEEGVNIIRQQSRLMTRLVNDLGHAIQLEAGQIDLQPEELDLRPLARGAAERAQVQTDRHSILVEAPAEPVVGVWDRVRLEEVLDNLLSNAVKYSPQGGEVIVRLGVADEKAFLNVVDQGNGIPAEMVPRLFERFQRGEGTGTPGLGLGLYIARMLIEAHGGRIRVESTPGKGSTFTFWLRLPDAGENRTDAVPSLGTTHQCHQPANAGSMSTPLGQVSGSATPNRAGLIPLRSGKDENG